MHACNVHQLDLDSRSSNAWAAMSSLSLNSGLRPSLHLSFTISRNFCTDNSLSFCVVSAVGSVSSRLDLGPSLSSSRPVLYYHVSLTSHRAVVQ